MEKLFNHVDITLNWDVLFGFFSIIAFIVTWLIKFTSNSNKDISLKYLSIEKLIDKPNKFSNELKILLNGIEIEQLSKIDMILENSGSRTLNKTDFHISPKINLEGFTNIINLEISSSNKFTTCKTRKIDLTQVEILIEDFEANDFIKIELFFESILNDYIPKFEFKLKESEEFIIDLKGFCIEQHFGVSKDYNAFFLIVPISGIITTFLTFIFIWLGLEVDIENIEKASIGWKAIFWVPTILVIIYSIMKWNKIITKHHFTFQKIEKWYSIVR